jgi:hypothetical protein
LPPTHRPIQAFGVVHAFVSRKMTENELPQHSEQEHAGRSCRSPHRPRASEFWTAPILQIRQVVLVSADGPQSHRALD